VGAQTNGSEHNVEQAVPFLAVSDIQGSVRWYVNGLGFSMTRKWMDGGELRWCWLEHGGAALMLQEYELDPHGSRAFGGRRGEGVTIYFICADALAIYRDAVSRGLHPEEPFVGNGMWVTMLDDPDGYRLGFESPTDVPEDTRYSKWHPAGPR